MSTRTSIDLDDANQSVFFLPYTQDEDAQESQRNSKGDSHIIDDWNLKAYTHLWGKCLDRVQEVIESLQQPLAKAIADTIQNTYNDSFPGLPRPELPFICVINPTFSNSFWDAIGTHLSEPIPDKVNSTVPYYLAHLHSADVANLPSIMKAMISGLMGPSTGKTKRRPATSLAPYDIAFLRAWYQEILEENDFSVQHKPKLLILLHDFEQFDSLILQDLFYICSLYVQELPFVFLAMLSSPMSSTFFINSLNRSSRALLHVRNFVAPTGTAVLEEILTKTFFDANFEPQIMLGPGILTFILNYFIRNNSQIHSVITTLQESCISMIAYMKHLLVHPLAYLAYDSAALHHLSTMPNSVGFLSDVLIRTARLDITDALRMVQDASQSFFKRVKRIRLAFHLVKLVQEYMESQGYKGLNWEKEDRSAAVVLLMVDVLEAPSEVELDARHLAAMIRKLKLNQLDELLTQLYESFEALPFETRSDEEVSRALLIGIRTQLSQLEDTQEGDPGMQTRLELGQRLAGWFTDHVSELLVPLESGALWDIWYSGRTIFPAEVLNPTVRASTTTGLLRPNQFGTAIPLPHSSAHQKLRDTSPLNTERDADRARKYLDRVHPGGVRPFYTAGEDGLPEALPLWEMPDTSILFRRYLDSGKMINVYDWFESFQLVLETQRKRLAEVSRESGVGNTTRAKVTPSRSPSRPYSPSKDRSERKGSQRRNGTNNPDEGNDNEGEDHDEEAEERWRMQVQARFLRALQELDYIGFIKHTNRKPDHVLRTVFDIGD